MRGTRTARAVEALYRRHVAEVYRYAYAMLGNQADAEDVTQTTFMNALRAFERGERPRKPSSWLLAIAHNVVRQRFRQAQARPIEVELSSDLAGVEQDEGSGPTIEEMLKALGRIPHLQREAIVLREFEGRAYAEIARILGITPSALETLLFRARRSLAEELEAAVTCEQAELAISRRLDARLSRKERRRLDQHLRECPSCTRFELIQRRGRRSFKFLALLPVPASLTLFKGAPSASAAAALPSIGAAGAGVGGGTAAGGLVGGGIAVKVAVAVAAVGVAGGAGYTGVKQVRDDDRPPAPGGVIAKREQASAVERPTKPETASSDLRGAASPPAARKTTTRRMKTRDRTSAALVQVAHPPGNARATPEATEAEQSSSRADRTPKKGARRAHAVVENEHDTKPKTARGKARAAAASDAWSKPAKPVDTRRKPKPSKKPVAASKKKEVAGTADAPAPAKTPPGQAKQEPEPEPPDVEAASQPAQGNTKPDEPPGKPEQPGGGKK
jgi:RNA polymerase sigma factor CnrH